MSAPLLCTKDLSAGYNGVAAVHDLNIELGAGEVVAILGANGAGKTTTLLTLAGALPALAGEVLLNGERTRAPLHRRARSGVALVPEERSVFMRMSTYGNLRVGRGSPERALEIFPELRAHLRRKAGLLSGGQQQMLTLARALAAAPAALLVDELSLGLAPLLVRRLLEVVREASHEHGVGVLLVEQHVRFALGVADRAYVLRRGAVALQGSAEELRERIDEIERAYLRGPESQPSHTPLSPHQHAPNGGACATEDPQTHTGEGEVGQ